MFEEYLISFNVEIMWSRVNLLEYRFTTDTILAARYPCADGTVTEKRKKKKLKHSIYKKKKEKKTKRNSIS